MRQELEGLTLTNSKLKKRVMSLQMKEEKNKVCYIFIVYIMLF